MLETKLVRRGTNGPSREIKEMCSQMEFWGELTQETQRKVLTETQGLYDDLAGIKQLKMSAGRHVRNLHKELVGDGDKRSYFIRFMQSLDQSVRSSYRWMNILVDLNLPEPVLDAAERRGVDLIQASYVRAVKALPPPPKTIDADGAEKYLDRAIKQREKLVDADEGGPVDTTQIEREAWKAVVKRYEKIPSRARRDWVSRLFGHIMAACNLPAQRFEPEAVPEGFGAKPRGRRSKSG
jgi:hypothetical protein